MSHPGCLGETGSDSFEKKMLLQSLMHLQFCKRKRMTTMSEEKCKKAIGRVTDCEPSNQMGTREQEQEMSHHRFICYLLLRGSAIRTGRTKSTGRNRERMGNGSEFKHCEKEQRKRLKQGEHEAEEPESAAHQLALI